MSNNPGVVWQFGQHGAEDVKARLQELHSEFQKGQIGIGQYAQGKRELSRDTRALTNDLTVEKNVLLASNPALLQLTQTLSIFSSVAHTALSVINAINLANLVGSQYEAQISDLKIKRAEIQNQLNKLDKEGLGNSAQAQLLKGQEAEIDSQIAAKEKEIAQQRLQNTIQQVASWTLIVSSAVTAAPKIIAQIDIINRSLLGMGSVTGMIARGSVIGTAFVAGIILGFLGVDEVMRQLDRNFGTYMNDLEKHIKDAWNVDDLTARLASPFVNAYADWVFWGQHLQTYLDNLYIGIENDLIDLINFFKTHIPFLGDTLSHIKEKSYFTPNQALNTILYPGDANALKSFLPPGGADASKATKDQTAATYEQIASNKGLVDIYTSTLSPTLNAVAKTTGDLNSSSITLKDAIGTLTQQITVQNANTKLSQGGSILSQAGQAVQNQINALSKQLTPVSANLLSSGGSYRGDNADEVHALQSINAHNAVINAQIADLQSKLSQIEVGSQALLADYLPTLGLSANTGLGSVVSSAIGLGGGITGQDIHDFINTHDYGVFTKAAMRDATASNPINPVTGQPIDLAKASRAEVNAYAAAIQAQGIKKSATGYDSMVSGPTLFMAGEAGPEYVSIGRGGGRGGGGDVYVSINAGTIIAERELMDRVRQTLKQDLKDLGWNR